MGDLLPKAARTLFGVLCFVVLWASWLWPREACAEPALRLDGGELQGVALGGRVDILEDKARAFTIDDVALGQPAAAFTPSHETSPGFGMTTSAYWVRFQVDNRTLRTREWLLELAYPPIDDVRLFVPNENGGFEERITGDQHPFANREVPYRAFLFRLEEPPGVRTYYLRAASSGVIEFPLLAWTDAAFFHHLSYEQPPMWIFYGFMLVMAAYNFFIFLSIRESTYFYYVMYIVFFTAFVFSLDGFAAQYLFNDWVFWNNKILTISLGLSLAFGLEFERRVLSVEKWMPRANGYARFVVFGVGILGLASLALPYAVSLRFIVVWGLQVTVVGVVVAWVITSRGSREARYYVMAWTALIGGIVAALGKSLGILPVTFVTTWGLQIGAAVEVTLLSLGLADRIKRMTTDLEGLNAQLTANVVELSDALRQAEAAKIAIAEKKRLESELQIAAHIQTAILPRDPQIEGLEWAARMVPAAEVGGDYYDVFPFEGGCWIGIGDVAGHGLPAGLVMLMIQSVVYALVQNDPSASPARIVRELNSVLFENVRKRLQQTEHATFSLIRYEKSGRLVHAGAHEDIVVCRAKTGRCELWTTAGPWIGAVRTLGPTLVDTAAQLEHGDLVVLYTDGLVEARNDKGELFGPERLAETVELLRAETVTTICDRLLASVQRWSSVVEDDITVVVLRYGQPAAT